MSKKYFSMAFFLLLATSSFAQVTGRTIKWKVESVRDILTGLPSTELGNVITYSDKIEFLALHNGQTQSYFVKKTISTWTNLNEDGKAIFQVENGNKKGIVVITKANGKLFITLGVFDQSVRTIFDFSCTGYEIISQ